MPKVSAEHRLRRVRQIQDAAARAFARKGFQATSMSDIIAESGLSAGAIYGHFSGKTEIIRAVAFAILTDRLEEVQHPDEETPPEPPGAVAASLIRLVLNDLGDPRLFLQVWGEAMVNEPLREAGAEAVGRVKRAFETQIRRWCIARGDSPRTATVKARTHAPLLVSLCQGFLVQQALDASFDGSSYLKHLRKYVVP